MLNKPSLLIIAIMLLCSNLHAQPDIYLQHTRDELDNHPALHEFLNLNGWFYYEKVDGKYDISSGVNPSVFRENYHGGPYPSYTDRNFPDQLQLQTINIESYDFADTTNPDWKVWADQVEAILYSMKSSGREVVTYGLDADKSFATYWEYYRRQYVINRTDLAKDKLESLNRINSGIKKTYRRFRSVTEFHSISTYTPYWIPSADSWQMHAYLYQLEQRIRFRKSLADKPVVVWLQPNCTKPSPGFGKEAFAPLPDDVWERIVKFCKGHPDIDKMLIFTLKYHNGKDVMYPANWIEILND